MKKIFTLGLAFAFCSSLSAEELKTITLGQGLPGIDEPQLTGLGISPDGRYVCGAVEYGEGGFVTDLVNNVTNFEMVEDSAFDHVNNQGVAIGYLGDMGVTYSWNGEYNELKTPEGSWKYILGEDLSDDGSILVGSLVGAGFATYAAYSENGGEWKQLPAPSAELQEIFGEDSSAKCISGDGKYIVGHIGNFGPIIVWTRQEDGSYQVDPLFARFCAYDGDITEERNLDSLTPQAISNNGKYILCSALQYVVDEDGFMSAKTFPAVYDTENGSLKRYDEPQEIDEIGLGLTGSAIADDGTFVGIIGTMAMYNCVGTFIMKAGENQAQTLVASYPEYAEMFEFSDMIGYSVATGISADARYILGYAFYSADFYDDEEPSYFLTFIIDTQAGGSSVNAVVKPSAAEEVYSLEGVRLSEMKRGINIVRKADGSVCKVIRK